MKTKMKEYEKWSQKVTKFDGEDKNLKMSCWAASSALKSMLCWLNNYWIAVAEREYVVNNDTKLEIERPQMSLTIFCQHYNLDTKKKKQVSTLQL